MKEKEEDWEKQLDSVILEIVGLNEILILDPNLLQLLSKLEGLRSTPNIQFVIYRKTIFETISLLQEFEREFNR